MIICHASNFLTGCHQKCGGAEMACYLVAEGMREKGIANFVLTLTHDKKNSLENVRGIISMEDILGKRIGRFYKVLIPFDPIIHFSAKKAFRELKPDILHLHNFSFLSLALILAAKKMQIPIVYSVYDYWTMCPTETLERPDGKPCELFHGKHCKECFKGRRFSRVQSILALARKPIFNYFLKQISQFITLSENSKEILIKYGLPEDKIKTIRLPMPKSMQLNTSKKIEEDSIFFAGWIEKRKGLHVLIEAMPDILRDMPTARQYALGMATDKLETAKINATIEAMNLKERVFFTTERMPKEIFNATFSKASIVAVPEQWVNMSPVMVIEAMAQSKPIAASNIGGMPEFIKDGYNGKLVSPTDAKEWAQAICAMLKNRAKLKQMRENTKKMFHKIYNRDKIFDELTGIYSRLIQNERMV